MTKLKDISLVVYDFDGVMTDNRVYVDQHGTESVCCNRADGLGVGIIRALGVTQVIISTEKNPVVQARAKKLGLEAIHGVDAKESILREFCQQRDLPLGEVAYIGNDVNDLEAMALVGLKVCPLDAHDRIKEISDIIVGKVGGDGVIRAFADQVQAARS